MEFSTIPQTANAPGSENVLVPVISTALAMAAAIIVNPIMNTSAIPSFCFMLIFATHMMRRGRDMTVYGMSILRSLNLARSYHTQQVC